jgi:hypothetical protein
LSARELEEDAAARKERLRGVEEEAEREKVLVRQHVMAMMRSGKKVDDLPLYSHVAMVLIKIYYKLSICNE